MIHIKQWHKVAVVAVFLWLMCGVSAGAYDFSADNIYYNINDKTLTAEVTCASSSYNSYSGRVVIPAVVRNNGRAYNVTGVGENAFRDCAGLTGVVFGANVATIGRRAFLNCSALTGVTITGGVTEIGDYAFAQCGALSTVTMNNDEPVQLGNGAFMRCSELKNVSWLSSENLEGLGGLTSVGTNAFAHCSALTSIVLPGALEHLGTTIFDGCTSLSSITVTSDHPLALSGDPFALESSVTIYVPSSGQSGASAALYQDAMGWRGYNIVELPYSFVDAAGYTYLKTSASTVAITGSMSPLAQVVVRNSITGYSGEHYNVTAIADRAFKGTAITTLNASNALHLRAIGTESFAQCSKLADVLIPEGVATMGDRAFASCSALKTIKLPSTLRTISKGAFDGCTALKTVTLLLGVATVSENAFAHCTSLTTLWLPSSVMRVEPGALRGASALKEVGVDSSNHYLTSVEGVLYEMKYGEEFEPEQAQEFSKLVLYPAGKAGETLYIPPGVTEIKVGAIQNATHLKKVAIPPTTTVFGENCFDGTGIEFVNYRCLTPSGTGTSGITAALKAGATLQVPPGTAATYRALTAWQGFKAIVERNDVYSDNRFAYDWNMRNEVTLVEIKAGAIEAGGKVSLPQGVSINGRAYVVTELHNTATAQVAAQVKNLVIGCDSLAVIDMSDDINPLAALTSLQAISISANNPYFKIVDNVLFNKRGNLLYYYLHSKSQNTYSLPEAVDTIMPQAFAQNKNLKVLAAHKNLKCIGNKAFEGCTALQLVDEIRGVTSIGNRAFATCSALTTVNGGELLVSIGGEAFLACGKLRQFPFCHGVLKEIGSHAFKGCAALTVAVMGSVITTIGEGAFEDCTMLSKVFFVSEMKNMGSRVFDGCTSLSELWLCNTVPPQVGPGIFDSSAAVTLYVPQEAASSYRTTAPWSSAAHIATCHYLDNGADVNDDKVVNAYDVTVAYSALLGDIGIVGHCDVNHDGAVTAADITIIYDYILTGNNVTMAYQFVNAQNEGIGQYVALSDGEQKIRAIDHGTNHFVTSGLKGVSDNTGVATVTLGTSQGAQCLNLRPIATGYFTLVAIVNNGTTCHYRAFPIVVEQ